MNNNHKTFFKKIIQASNGICQETVCLVQTHAPKELLQDWNIGIDSTVYSFQVNQTTIKIQEVYRAGKTLTVSPVGDWTNQNGLNYTETYMWERRQNLQQHTFHCATVNVRTKEITQLKNNCLND